MRGLQLIVAFALMSWLQACGSNSPSGPQPTPTPTPTPSPGVPVQLATFTDSSTGVSTSDVRDVQEQIVRFDVANNALIWAVDGRSFSGYPVDGNFIRSDRHFQVRFGSRDGQRRAYFTETATGTICDVEVVGSALVISPTNVTVPQA